VVDLDTARALTLPNGFETEFYWVKRGEELPWEIKHVDSFQAPPRLIEPDRLGFIKKHYAGCKKWLIVPAPLLSEMLELVPEYIDVGGDRYSLIVDVHSKRISYERQDCDGSIIELENTDFYFIKYSPATTAAKLYMWLIKNKHLTNDNK
jgi:hypothetical protein